MSPRQPHPLEGIVRWLSYLFKTADSMATAFEVTMIEMHASLPNAINRKALIADAWTSSLLIWDRIAKSNVLIAP
eukprot:scaffold155363_cov35-Tisochrysis_lutea.AAC.1